MRISNVSINYLRDNENETTGFYFFRRNKKKKIPLVNNEEVDMDLSAMDDSPVLWIRWVV